MSNRMFALIGVFALINICFVLSIPFLLFMTITTGTSILFYTAPALVIVDCFIIYYLLTLIAKHAREAEPLIDQVLASEPVREFFRTLVRKLTAKIA